MAAAMTMDREPEVARFIDSYKYDQDMATRRDRYGGGTSLPLNSDGYEEKQQRLRDERHKDWLVQQDKPRDPPVYYRVGTPEQGFPGLGEYDKHRKDFNLQRQKEYNDMLKKQRQMEQQKYEARRRSPPRPAQPPGPQMDYNLAGEQARAEERRAYQDYMGKNQYSIYSPQKPLMDYEQNKKVLSEERKREYNELLEKKAKEERYWAMRGRPVTPPGGLDIGKYDRQLKETAQQKKKEYKEMLDQQKFEQLKLRAMDHVADISPKYVRYRDEERPLVGSPRDINYYMQEQQREHMYLRARQEPEMAVIDRNAAQPSQYLANKPPPGPSYGKGRDESTRQTPAFWNDGRQARGPPSLNSDVSGSNRSTANVPMAFKTESQSQPIPERPRHGQPPYTGAGASQKGTGGGRYSSDTPKRAMVPVASPPKSPLKPVDRELLKVPVRDDERPSELGTPLAEERRRQDEMRQQQQMSKPAELVKNPYYSSDDYEKFQREIQRKQGEEYRDFLAKQFQPSKDAQGLPLGQYRYEPKRLALEAQRNKDYNELLKKQKYTNPSRRHDFVDTASGPYGGLFHGLGEHGNKSDVLNKERQQEYNDRLDHQFGKDRPSGRPNWVKETLPNNTDRGRSPMKSQPPADQYQQMLDEKRREEASRRRFEDPEYQDRLAQGRDRGEAGARYGY